MSTEYRLHEIEAIKLKQLYHKLDTDAHLRLVMEMPKVEQNPDKKAAPPDDVEHLGRGGYRKKTHLP